jgi:CheY-like chemotaxis protein
MGTQLPRVLCAAGHLAEKGQQGSRESISAILSDYDVTFARDTYQLIDLAHEDVYDLIVMNCLHVGERYAIACKIIRLWNTTTPVLFITNSSEPTAEQAAEAGAQRVCSTGCPQFIADVQRCAKELVYPNCQDTIAS